MKSDCIVRTDDGHQFFSPIYSTHLVQVSCCNQQTHQVSWAHGVAPVARQYIAQLHLSVSIENANIKLNGNRDMIRTYVGKTRVD